MDRPATLTAALVVALVATALAAAVAAAGIGRAEQGRDAAAPQTRRTSEPRRLEPVERLVGEPRVVSRAPAPREEAKRPATPPGFGVVRVRSGRSVRLYAKPKGHAIGSAGARTQFGSPAVMSVVRRQGRWLAVTTTALPNGKLAWVRADSPAVDRGRVRTAISVDLSERTVELRRGKKLVKRLRVAVGRPGSATPRGRFAITDKIPGSRYGSYYGCCILALNGTQPNTPPGWHGGNRLAIHGTNAPGSIGQASSAGCLRAADADLRTLMRSVPLGTPVFVHG
ncbi:MAG TPA: L,D-transpeptidase [Thermoleophilaceae bacterium]